MQFYTANVTLGGGALLLGTAATTTVSFPAARLGYPVIMSPQTDPGLLIYGYAYVSALDTVTARILCLVAGTPPSTVWNAMVLVP
jgi:hypothetical protein